MASFSTTASMENPSSRFNDVSNRSFMAVDFNRYAVFAFGGDFTPQFDGDEHSGRLTRFV